MPRFDITFEPQGGSSQHSITRTALGRDADDAKDAAWNAMRPATARVWYPVQAHLSAIQPTAPAVPGDAVTVFKNQGNREATVIAVLGDRCLVEYTMPSESTALYIALITEPSVSLRTVAYHKLTRPWRRAAVDGGIDWEGKPQQSHYDYVKLLADGRVVGVETGTKYIRRGYLHGRSGLNWTQLTNPIPA